MKLLTYDHTGQKGEYRPAPVLPTLDPIALWPNISKPESYLEERAGKYIALLEGLLDRALETRDVDAARVLALDLLKMTPIGRNKAEININKNLRDEISLDHLDPEMLENITKRHATDTAKRLDLSANPHNIAGGTSALAAAGVKKLGKDTTSAGGDSRDEVGKRRGRKRKNGSDASPRTNEEPGSE